MILAVSFGTFSYFVYHFFVMKLLSDSEFNVKFFLCSC